MGCTSARKYFANLLACEDDTFVRCHKTELGSQYLSQKALLCFTLFSEAFQPSKLGNISAA
jgi:hypothetical protein